MKDRRLGYYFVLIYSLAIIRFFIPAFVPQNLLYYFYYALFIGTVFYVIIKYKTSYNNRFTTPVFLLLLAFLLSCFSAALSWDQNIIDSIKPASFYMGYILFFLLHIIKLRDNDISKIIITLGILYIIVYIITFVSFPKQIFGVVGHYGAERGFQRIITKGLGFLFLFSFYSLNRYYEIKKPRWLIYYIITLVFIIMTLTRTLIAISFIFSVLFILRKSSNLKKILSVVVIIISIYFISQMSFVRIMMRETEKQTAHWENDIRVRSADYFLHHFSPTTVAKIFGNGQPYQNTHYDYFVGQILGKRYGYFTDDIGYIGIYVTFGILAIIALFLVFYRMVKIKLPDEYEYIRYFMYFIFITSIIIGVAISPDYIPSIVFAIYIMSSKDLSQSYHRKIL